MQEEIFGPVLPILKYSDLQSALKIINSNGKRRPLALYIFSNRRPVIDSIIEQVQSGGVVVNDVMMHFANSHTPFGGIGASGLGQYHGWHSFECFSQKRVILRRDCSTLLDVPVRYPPYTAFGLKFFKFASKVPDLPGVSGSGAAMILVGTLASIAVGIYFNNISVYFNQILKRN